MRKASLPRWVSPLPAKRKPLAESRAVLQTTLAGANIRRPVFSEGDPYHTSLSDGLSPGWESSASRSPLQRVRRYTSAHDPHSPCLQMECTAKRNWGPQRGTI
jgi:hypothetical protein